MKKATPTKLFIPTKYVDEKAAKYYAILFKHVDETLQNQKMKNQNIRC